MLRDGLEPPSPDYKTGILAFVLTEHYMVAEEVFETSNPAYEAFIYPDSPRLFLVEAEEIESF